MELFPAVMIGGPPHSGKSVLAYSLTQALRRRGVAHYVLRAFPDGEGDWANEADQALVRRIRVKSQITPDWIDYMCRDIVNRHLPLLVDVGGRPTPWQEAVFDHCTHALLLTPNQEHRELWHDLAGRHDLIPVADLHSVLAGPQFVETHRPVLRGQISGLERGQSAHGPTFEALVDTLAQLFAYDEAELRTAHLSLAPTDLVVELGRIGQALGFGRDSQRWQPAHLPQLLDYLPPGTPLALYDRGPNWLYAALAGHAHPAPLFQFDVRLGWVEPPALTLSPASPDAALITQVVERPAHTRLEFSLAGGYLDYGEAEGLTVPPAPAERGVVLSGKLPLWLWTALARAYGTAPWLAVFQPPLGGQAVVVASRDAQQPVGSLVASAV